MLCNFSSLSRVNQKSASGGREGAAPSLRTLKPTCPFTKSIWTQVLPPKSVRMYFVPSKPRQPSSQGSDLESAAHHHPHHLGQSGWRSYGLAPEVLKSSAAETSKVTSRLSAGVVSEVLAVIAVPVSWALDALS